jgi:hypothetical protein
MGLNREYNGQWRVSDDERRGSSREPILKPFEFFCLWGLAPLRVAKGAGQDNTEGWRGTKWAGRGGRARGRGEWGYGRGQPEEVLFFGVTGVGFRIRLCPSQVHTH